MITALHRASGEVEKALREAVDRARHEGRTWTEIGEAMEMSKQAAWERFAMDASGSEAQRRAGRVRNRRR